MKVIFVLLIVIVFAACGRTIETIEETESIIGTVEYEVPQIHKEEIQESIQEKEAEQLPDTTSYTTYPFPDSAPDCSCWTTDFEFTLSDTPTHEAYRWIAPTVFDMVGPVTGGYLWVVHCCRFGIINQNGEFIIPLIYEGFTSSQFPAWVSRNKFEYKEYINVSSGFLAAELNGKWGVINMANKEVLPFIYDGLNVHQDYSVATVSVGDRRTTLHTGLINLITGDEIVPLGRYNRIYSVSDGYAIAFNEIRQDGNRVRQEGLINITTGEEVIPLIHEQVWMLPEYRNFQPSGFVFDYIFFNQDNFVGLNDMEGNQLLPPIFDRIELSNMPENLAMVYNLCPDTGVTLGGIANINTAEIIVPIRYHHLWYIGESRAIAFHPETFLRENRSPQDLITKILIDVATGKEIAEITYAFDTGHISNFYGGVAVISTGDAWDNNWRAGLIDNMGREIFPPVNAHIRHFTKQLLILDDRDERVFSHKGRILCKHTWEEVLPWHDHVGRLVEGLALINTGGTWVPFEEWIDEIVGGYWGFINETGYIVIPAMLDFDRVSLVRNNANIAAVQRDGKWGIIYVS